MKRFVLLLAAVCCLTWAKAQDVSFGPKLGINLANQSGDINNTDMKLGLRGGVFADIGLTEKFSIQPELMYSSKGSKYSQSQTLPIVGTIEIEGTNSLSYLSLPVLAKYNFVDDGFKFYANAGPYFDFLLSANQEIKTTMGGQTQTTDTTVTDQYKGLDMGLAFGAGVGFEVGEGELRINLRYSLGLTDVAAEYEQTTTTTNPLTGNTTTQTVTVDPSVTNSVLSLGVGYAF